MGFYIRVVLLNKGREQCKAVITRSREVIGMITLLLFECWRG